MIENLVIQNFKNIQLLNLFGLGRVNLFTGKNNVGKSSLLEAIALYVNEGSLNIIYQLLSDRGEVLSTGLNNSRTPYETQNTEALSSLFTDRITGFSTNHYITINKTASPETILTLRLVKFLEQKRETDEGVLTKRTIIEEHTDYTDFELNSGLEIKNGDKQLIFPLNKEPLHHYASRSVRASKPEIPFQYIKSINTDSDDNGRLWDNITLTEKEFYVVNALRIIEPRIERIAFVGEHPKERSAVVKIKNYPKVIPIRSMGDGINRILSIILSLVNSDNGFLLIDEFENGLHHSVQADLWEIIFRLSKELNIQVFATTHSNDCIKGFEEALGGAQNSGAQNSNSAGKLFRLEERPDQRILIPFNWEELKIATEEDIETR